MREGRERSEGGRGEERGKEGIGRESESRGRVRRRSGGRDGVR